MKPKGEFQTVTKKILLSVVKTVFEPRVKEAEGNEIATEEVELNYPTKISKNYASLDERNEKVNNYFVFFFKTRASLPAHSFNSLELANMLFFFFTKQEFK